MAAVSPAAPAGSTFEEEEWHRKRVELRVAALIGGPARPLPSRRALLVRTQLLCLAAAAPAAVEARRAVEAALSLRLKAIGAMAKGELFAALEARELSPSGSESVLRARLQRHEEAAAAAVAAAATPALDDAVVAAVAALVAANPRAWLAIGRLGNTARRWGRQGFVWFDAQQVAAGDIWRSRSPLRAARARSAASPRRGDDVREAVLHQGLG